MKLLPESQRTFALYGDHIEAGLHEHQGCRWFTKFVLPFGADKLATGDDFVGRLVDVVDHPAIL